MRSFQCAIAWRSQCATVVIDIDEERKLERVVLTSLLHATTHLPQSGLRSTIMFSVACRQNAHLHPDSPAMQCFSSQFSRYSFIRCSTTYPCFLLRALERLLGFLGGQPKDVNQIILLCTIIRYCIYRRGVTY